MVTENADKKREQIHLLCMDEMVPKDHLLRIIDKAIDWIMAQLSRQKWFFPMLVEMIGDFYSYMCYTERKIFLLGRRYIWMNLLNF